VGSTNGVLLPIPELTESADGPKAVNDLANAVEDYFYDRVLPTGVVRYPIHHWGSGTALPTVANGVKTGDTYLHTGLGCMMRFITGTTWRQAEPALVASLAARDAIATNYSGLLYDGFEVHMQAGASGEKFRWNGSIFRRITNLPVFATLAARDAYYTTYGPPQAGAQCICLGSHMDHDGTTWRFILAGGGQVNSDASALSFIPHGGGQAPRRWVAGAAGSSTDGATVITKPMEFGSDAVNLTARFARTDTSAYYASATGLGIDYIIYF
jgi:hypothetical protein